LQNSPTPTNTTSAVNIATTHFRNSVLPMT